ncbi:MAG: carbamoyltransferase HypF [Bryobacteraceae bacterium]|nr:carbamoyltransferase HypF [Bryobacteraceae bacterium]
MGLRRLRVHMAGAVQGVGFRPFVYRLASELDLKGWVLNSGSGLVIEAEGPEDTLEQFLVRLETERPRASVVLAREVSVLEPAGYASFEIRRSDEQEEKTVSLLPDLATCPDCLRELNDPADRRYRYPFTNCTACGPRYTIILDIPYDRPRTTMRDFQMCPDCLREYTDPADRRFHAQPNACPVCGPRVWIETAANPSVTAALPPDRDPIRAAAEALRAGRIVALKGIGGFQLLVDARNEEAVARLRRLKQREEKPFALMAPTLDCIRQCAEVSDAEERLLRSPAAPIVLLRPHENHPLAPNVAQSSPYLGFMLPYSPLHHLLMEECGFPIVATSGNLTDEPIAIGNQEARARLGGIADLFLMHDRPVARPCDDSVARVSRGRESVLRRARGYAPLPVLVRRRLPAVLAVGGHLKNTVAIAVGRQVYLSQHVGDLDTAEARRAFVRAIEDLCRLYRFQPELVACDLHPDYASTHWAQSSGLPVYAVQHHHAHVASCAAENDLEGEYLGVGWDGTGFGLDGSVWGGEFFLVQDGKFERVAHLRPFRLPGGEAAVKEGWRVSASLCFETFGPDAVEKPTLLRMLERGVNSPWSTSVGRLFDAIAALAGVARTNRFEGQAAMQLERAIGRIRTEDCYPLDEKDGVADWRPLIRAVQYDVGKRVSAGLISARFHNTLAAWIVRVARRTGVRQVALSGGVFQNSYLTERAAALLEQAGIRVATHQRVPANDGGLALGQAVIAGQAFSGGF